MAQDEHFVSSSNSGGDGGAGGAGSAGAGTGNNRSKTPKPKKVPQRGLGVAQLEKLRIEEQRKKEALLAANVLANNAIGPGNESLQAQNIGGGPTPKSLSPLGPAHMTSDCGEHTLWSGECNSSLGEGGMENQKVVVDNAGFLFGGPQVNVNLRRPYQFQRPPSQMMNVSSGNSPPPISSSQIEPPSIQNVRGNNYTPSWPEDDKIVGIKRLYPFSLEGPPIPSFLGGNFHTTYGELASCSNEPRNKYTRDCASNSTLSVQNPSEDERLIGGFLSLAPPSNTKNKHQPLDLLGHNHQGPNLSDYKSLSTQENIKSSQSHQLGTSSSKEQAFTFFPIKSQTENSRNGNGDKGEKLDLNLKL
ncbi:high-level expression of sugar-inducible gene 2 [Striga asiatica]|uniref:High-level expression of sugar-inducible gene 2 n=1 Tax=Striga asiatica TaxID=4170 RepID=A0A5A7QCX5_STRAF|nr:high-level expression of sugar-inducible gene 2 [Striga asiatica]